MKLLAVSPTRYTVSFMLPSGPKCDVTPQVLQTLVNAHAQPKHVAQVHGKEGDSCIYIVQNIQGDSGAKVNVLGRNSIGHCEKTRSYERVSNC
jgi:hypothetical protein